MLVNPVPVHLGAKGRVVLPASIRRTLGLEEGAELLARGEIQEGVVTIDELRAAERLWLINSVRGWRAASLSD